jgi:hypothetical protein
MGPFAKLTAKHNAAFLAISHLNKGEGNALYRITGSLAFVALARAAFLLTHDKEQPERKLLLRVKNNLSPLRTGLAFSLVAIGEDSVPTLAWETEPVEMTANDALAPVPRASGETKLEAVEKWLRATLADGPVLQETIEADAKGVGISTTGVLRRAKKELGVISRKRTYQGKYEWSLPTHPSACTPLTEPAPDKASSNDEPCTPLVKTRRDAERRSAPGNNSTNDEPCTPLNEAKQNAGSVNDERTSPGVGDNDYEEVF